MVDVWPVTLPTSPLMRGFSESGEDQTVRTSMDVGPGKVRRRLTAGVRDMTWPFLLTTAQIATLDTFFYTTLLGGALPFTHPDPRTGTSKSWRFTEKPEYRPESATKWSTVLKVEQLP